jgi:putative membrane protein
MMWNGYGMNGWGMIVMTLSQLAFWALLIGGAIYLFRTYGPRGGSGQSAASAPEQILAERYARGEIDEEEYRRRLGTLRGVPS